MTEEANTPDPNIYYVGNVDVPEYESVAEFTPPTDEQPFGPVVEFPLTAKEQRWGHELLFAHTAAYTGKILFRRGDPTYKGRIQYHFNIDETFYLLSGRCILRWVAPNTMYGPDELQTREIGPGESFHIPRFARHSVAVWRFRDGESEAKSRKHKQRKTDELQI